MTNVDHEPRYAYGFRREMLTLAEIQERKRKFEEREAERAEESRLNEIPRKFRRAAERAIERRMREVESELDKYAELSASQETPESEDAVEALINELHALVDQKGSPL